jgi:hypothetical protein
VPLSNVKRVRLDRGWRLAARKRADEIDQRAPLMPNYQ